MKRILMLVVGCILGAAVTFSVIFIRDAREQARRSKCFANIYQTHKAFLMFSMEHNNQFPTNIADMATYANNMKLFVCPSSGRIPPTARSVTELKDWLDYIYVPWPNGEETPGDYPQMYDRRMSHHRGEGINLVLVNGGAFWDQGAGYLLQFAVTHPDLHVPLPEDLKPPVEWKGMETRANKATDATR
jgi:hypothetical protein